MHAEYWLKQEKDKPAFPDILWARPENKVAAGKLLIVGGNAHGFAHVGEAYSKSIDAGAGIVRVLLPDTLRKIVGKFIENCDYAPSNPSGGFAKQALAELLIHSQWADAVLLAGDFGHNSETEMMLEEFVQKYKGLLIVTGDGLDYFYQKAAILLNRPSTCIVGSLAQLHKLAMNVHFTKPLSLSLDLVRLVSTLNELSKAHAANMITHHTGTTTVASGGRVSTTLTGTSEDIWRTETSAKAAVHWMQNPLKPFEAMTSSVL